MSEQQKGLAAVLRAQHAAVYLYGVIDAYASPARRAAVGEFRADHRAARDAAAAAYERAGSAAPAAAAAYRPPLPITDPVSAARAAIAVEVDCSQAYRELLAKAADEQTRRLAVNGLTGSAARAARWRIAVDAAPSTEAFPGSPT